MSNKLKIWSEEKTWEEAEADWDKRAQAAKAKKPNRGLTTLPEIPGITQETAKNLKLKSLVYMVKHDEKGKVFKQILKHPFKYLVGYIRSLLRKSSYVREGDFFIYNLKDVEAFEEKLKSPNTLLVLGFSYCQKPHECPSGRFNDQCAHDLESPVCQQCPIGKMLEASEKKKTLPLLIPTIHYIGENILKIVHEHPEQEVIFLITACEMTLEMFGDWGNMVGVKGIGVRLDGRICNTMRAFELSEQGIKPGLTVVLSKTERRMLDLLKIRRLSSL